MTDDRDRPDPDLLAAARRALRTGGTRDTVEEALAAAVRRHRHDRAVAAEAERLAPAAGTPRDPDPPPGLPRGWLLDHSARVAAARSPAVAAGLRPLLAGGLLVTCPLLDLAALTALASAEPAADLRRVVEERRLAYRSVSMGPATGDRALELHRVLARAARPEAADPATLLVAATALEHGLGVLHRHPGLALLGRLAGLVERAVAPVDGARADDLGRAS